MKCILLVTAFLPSIAYADEPSHPPLDPHPVTPVTSAPHAVVLHVPPLASQAGAEIVLEAQIDAPFAEQLAVAWRAVGDAAWHDVPFERAFTGGWFAGLPAAKPPGVEYYIHGRDAAGADVAHFASAQSPHVVRVTPSLVDRLEDVDVNRLSDHRNEVSFDVVGHDFGNRYGVPDRYLRAEVAYARKLWRELHQVTFGFGAIQGSTPMVSEPGASAVEKGLRYGFGEVRWRLLPALFIDARGMLGASKDGFTGGGRGQLTFGKPWRSNVSVGGEFLGDAGPSAWVRLQWDTAPPLLMAASIVRTDLPGALISQSGLYVAYDLAYRAADRLTIKTQLSYGARDGAAHFGGGLGTSIDF